MIPNDAGDDLLVQIRLLGGNQCSNGKNPQGVGYGKGSFRGILSSREGKRVRSPLALAVDVDPADLVDQRVDQSRNLVRIAAENADLLAVARIDHVLDGLIDLVEGQDGNHRSELLFMIHSHFRVDRIQDGGKKEAAANRSSGGINDPGALGNSVRHQFPQVIRLAFFRDRCHENPFLPWHSKGQGVNGRGKAFEKRVRDAGFHKEDLKRRATLPVKGKAAENAFPYGQIEIGAFEHNGRILGLQPQHAAKRLGWGAVFSVRWPSCSCRSTPAR